VIGVHSMFRGKNSLLKSYNRRYYRRITIIKINMHWRMLRLHIANKILKFAFVISPDAKDAIESRMLKHPRSHYWIEEKLH
jgi:hypothetical protein